MHVTTSNEFDSPQVSAFPYSKFYFKLATPFILAMFKKALEESTPRPHAAVDEPIPQHRSTTLSAGVTSDKIFFRRSTPSYADKSIILVANGAITAENQLLFPKL